jgi:hypothetical protein
VSTLAVTATTQSSTAPATNQPSSGRSTEPRALLRATPESKPRASIAVASRVARRSAPTSRVNAVPASSRAPATGFRPASTPRARRASRIDSHSVASSGTSRRAASAP